MTGQLLNLLSWGHGIPQEDEILLLGRVVQIAFYLFCVEGLCYLLLERFTANMILQTKKVIQFHNSSHDISLFSNRPTVHSITRNIPAST